MSSTTSSDSEFGFQTKSEISRFDVDGDGKFTASELRSIDQALLQSKETISLLKRVAAGLSILLLLIAIALGSTTSVMIYDAIREPTTGVAPSTTDGGAGSLVSPAGSQVQVVQSAAEMMLGMLPTFVQMSPLQAIKALPESIVLWDPYAQSWVALRPIKFAYRQWTQAVTIACASDERIVIRDEMHGMVFKNAAAVSEWDDLVAAGNAPDPSDDDGANASRFHFCAACVPIELKSLITNGMLDGVFARFDDNTKNRSCDGFAGTTDVTNGYTSESATSNVVAVCAECAAQRMTYTPQVCLPNPATRTRREEAEQDEAWASRRSEHIQTALERRKRGKCAE
jgi:hypothetical protein